MDGHLFSRRILIPGLLALGLAAAPVWAGNDVWTVAGQPSGGQVFKVVAGPTGTLYALANPGVFKSTDAGAHWSFVLSLGVPSAFDLAVDPVNPSNVYVANNNSGLWKSSDGGATWTVLTGIPQPRVVVVDPVTEGVVYAIANGCDVYKSTDGGTTWNLIDTGISGLTGNPDAIGTQIAVDPANPQVLYLATQVGDFQENTGANGGSSLSGLYTSVDGGAHWTQNLPTLAFADVVIDPNDDQNVYAGNYVSNDAGVSWAPAAGTATDLTVIAVDPANSQVMWGDEAITGNLWTTTDQGADWSQVTMPYGDSVYNVAYDPGTPATLYASSMAFGVYKSTDGGTDWTDSSSGITGVFVSQMFMDQSGAIYIGSGGTGVLKSTDQGASWTMMNNGLAVSPNADGIMVNALIESPTVGTLYTATDSGLYKTTDGGSSWSALSGINDGSSLAVDPEKANTVYVGAGGGQVYKSINSGSSWTRSGTGLHGDGISSIAVDPSDSNVIYAGGFQTVVYKSTDGGVTWSVAGTGIPAVGVGCVAIDPKTPTNVYACVENHGIYKSTDGGQTWSNASSDVSGFAFSILQIDPSNPAVIYAAIPGLGVWVSTDSSSHWVQLGNPSESSSLAVRTEAVAVAGTSAKTRASSAGITISALAVDPRSDKVYGAASDHQVYVYGNSNLTSSSGSSGASGSSGGGGGAFPLLSLLFLFGTGLMRRRRG